MGAIFAPEEALSCSLAPQLAALRTPYPVPPLSCNRLPQASPRKSGIDMAVTLRGMGTIDYHGSGGGSGWQAFFFVSPAESSDAQEEREKDEIAAGAGRSLLHVRKLCAAIRLLRAAPTNVLKNAAAN